MIGWIARILMSLAAFVTAWFVARDAPNFGLIQVIVSMFLVILLIGGAAFWPFLVSLIRNRRGPRRPGG